MREKLACDDPIAARRYDYAQAAARDGDWGAAAEVLEQALELAPDWPPAWFALGEARERLGNRDGAVAAFRAALACDRDDAQGAAARLALLGAAPTPAALPPTYLARLFDDYAPRFDAHLRTELAYQAPERIVEALDRVAPARRFAVALDLGCGTGLAGAALRGRVDRLIGVDLSEGMIARAREAGLYDAWQVGDLVAFLGAPAAQGADLAVAADALVYFGDLDPVFAAVARALAPGGLFACSLEACEGKSFRLGAAMRFAHGEGYLRAAAARAGLVELRLAAVSTRREAGADVPGWVAVFRRPP